MGFRMFSLILAREVAARGGNKQDEQAQQQEQQQQQQHQHQHQHQQHQQGRGFNSKVSLSMQRKGARGNPRKDKVSPNCPKSQKMGFLHTLNPPPKKSRITKARISNPPLPKEKAPKSGLPLVLMRSMKGADL